jgi:hypothetical protein
MEKAVPTENQDQSRTKTKARKQKPADRIKVGSFNAEKGLKDKVREIEAFALKHRWRSKKPTSRKVKHRPR